MKPFVWLAIGGGAAIATSLVLLATRKAREVLPPAPTYGETVRITIPVPSGWRRATSAEVAALPELGVRANTLLNSPGFASALYGTLTPFVASDGKTYATLIEQHFHEPGGPGKPWGLHRGVTLLVRTSGSGSLLDEWRDAV